MNKFYLKIEKNIDKKKWNDLLYQTESYSLFSCIEYYEILKVDRFFVTAYNEDNLLIAGTICRVRGGTFPFSIFSKSLWIESELLVRKTNKEFEIQLKKNLLNLIVKEGQKQNCVIIKINHWCRETIPDIFVSNGFQLVPNCTFISDLTLSQEDLYYKLSRRVRRPIKKAETGGLIFNLISKCDTEIIEEFYSLYKQTQKRAVSRNKNVSMTLKSINFVKNILHEEKLNCCLSYVSLGNKLAAGVIIFKKGDNIVTYISGSDREMNEKYGASSFLNWKTMLWAKENGFKYFDIGGVPYKPAPDDPAYGVFQFKINFGGDIVQFIKGEKVLKVFRSKVFTYILNYRPLIRLMIKLNTNL